MSSLVPHQYIVCSLSSIINIKLQLCVRASVRYGGSTEVSRPRVKS